MPNRASDRIGHGLRALGAASRGVGELLLIAAPIMIAAYFWANPEHWSQLTAWLFPK
jgi:hypothetical protein